MIKDKPTDKGIQSINKVPQNKSQNDISKKTSPTRGRTTCNNRETTYKDKWQILTLDSAPLEIIDGDRGFNYPKQHDFRSNDYCLFLNAGNVTEEGFNFSDCSFISKERDKAMRKGKLIKGDLVLTTRGTVGNVAIYDDSVQFENVRINSGMVLLRSDNSRLLPNFLYYSLKSQFFRNQMKALITGSAQPQLPIQDIRKINIYLPPLSGQRQIAHFLGVFDEKIKLNQKMNKALEAIARAIFKHWFIDFEFPNEEGKPYKSSGGEMVDSERGKIPSEWVVQPLGSVLSLLKDGTHLPPNRIKDGIRFIAGATDIKHFYVDFSRCTYISEEEYLKIHKKWNPRPNDILLTIVGTVGNVALVRESDLPFSMQRSIALLRANEKITYTYLYFLVDSHRFKAELKKRINPTAQPGIYLNELSKIQVIVPTKKIVELFHSVILQLLDFMQFGIYNSQTLSDLRDTLLPKLVSGKIRVPQEE